MLTLTMMGRELWFCKKGLEEEEEEEEEETIIVSFIEERDYHSALDRIDVIFYFGRV